MATKCARHITKRMSEDWAQASVRFGAQRQPVDVSASELMNVLAIGLPGLRSGGDGEVEVKVLVGNEVKTVRTEYAAGMSIRSITFVIAEAILEQASVTSSTPFLHGYRGKADNEVFLVLNEAQIESTRPVSGNANSAEGREQMLLEKIKKLDNSKAVYAFIKALGQNEASIVTVAVVPIDALRSPNENGDRAGVGFGDVQYVDDNCGRTKSSIANSLVLSEYSADKYDSHSVIAGHEVGHVLMVGPFAGSGLENVTCVHHHESYNLMYPTITDGQDSPVSLPSDFGPESVEGAKRLTYGEQLSTRCGAVYLSPLVQKESRRHQGAPFCSASQAPFTHKAERSENFSPPYYASLPMNRLPKHFLAALQICSAYLIGYALHIQRKALATVLIACAIPGVLAQSNEESIPSAWDGCQGTPTVNVAPMPEGLSAADALAPMLTQSMPYHYESYALALARAEADPSLLSTLEEIVEVHACNPWLVYRTMLAIDVSGAPSSYFIDYLMRPGIPVCIAAKAIDVLGVRADSTVSHAISDIVVLLQSGAENNCSLDKALAWYELGLDMSKEFDDLADDERAEMAVGPIVSLVYGRGTEQEGVADAVTEAGDVTPSQAWAYERLAAIGGAQPTSINQTATKFISEWEQEVQLGPGTEEPEVTAFFGGLIEWEPPTPEEFSGWADVMRAEVSRVAFEGNPPALYIPGPGGVPTVDPTGLSAALVLDGDSLAGGSIVSRNFRIDGRDHDLAGQPTGDPGTHGIATTEALRQAALAAIPDGRLGNITGVGPAPDLVALGPGLDLDALVEAVLAHPDLLTLRQAPPGPLGTAEAPVVVYVSRPAAEVPQDYRGVGILVADGKVKLADGSEWVGLVVSRSEQPEIRLSGNARILGGAAATGGPISLRPTTKPRFSAAARRSSSRWTPSAGRRSSLRPLFLSPAKPPTPMRAASLLLFLLAIPAARGQQAAPPSAHVIPFGQAGNVLELVVGDGQEAALQAEVVLVEAPSWVAVRPERLAVAVGPEAVAAFAFDLLPAAPVGEAGTLVFEVQAADGRAQRHEVAIEAAAPARFALGAPSPNPSRERATLAVTLPAAGDLVVEAYDVLGRRVAVLHTGPAEAGSRRVALEAGALAAGPYVVRALWSGEGGAAEAAVRRLTVVR